MPVLDLTVAYDGKAFHGYARQIEETAQGPADKVRTVQGELEQALFLLYRREVSTVCCGRTDTGVHARQQHVSFELNEEEAGHYTLEKLQWHLNGILPEDVVVSAIRIAEEGFSARFSTVSRTYRYLICTGPVRPVALYNRAWWVKGMLDVEAMEQAAAFLLGTHDFTSYASAEGAKNHTTQRTILAISFERTKELGESCLAITVQGNAFLHNMIRIMVGTLVEVGLAHRQPQWVEEVLQAKDRRAAGQTAPACGLTFWHAEY